MLEKQRTHLENLIDSRVSFAVQAEQKIGTKWEGQSKMVAEQVEGTLKEYLDFIQSYMGTQKCASCGCSPNQLSSDVELGPCDCWDCTKRREVLKDE